MTVVRLAPNGTVSNTGTVTGAASAHEALADDSDASYVTYPGAYYSWLNLADLSLPTGAVVTAVTVFYRAEFTGTTSIPAATKVYAGSQSASDTRNVSAFVAEYVGANIYGGLSDADVDGATITIGSSFSLAGSLVVYKAGLEVHYFVQPTVDVIAPTGTITSNIPTVEWTPTFDPDALYGQYYKQIKIFSEAQYTAGGFDPSTSTATNDAGTVYNSAGSHGFNDVLSNGNYRAYTRVASYNQPDQWSAWNYEAFTVNAPLPGVPTLSATANNSTGSIRLSVNGTSGAATTDQFELQRTTEGNDAFTGMVNAASPALFLPLTATDGLTDLSGNGRDGTTVEGESVTVGGFSPGPLVVGDDGATDFDGFNDRIISGFGTRRNYVPNPSFGVDTASWLSAGAAGLTRRTGSALFGSQGLLVETAATVYSGAQSASITVPPSLAYCASAYVRAATAGDVGKTVSFILRELDAADAQIGDSVVNIVLTDSWQRVSAARTFSASGVGALVWAATPTATAVSFDFDAVLLEQSSVLGDYFDGEFYWDGSAPVSGSGLTGWTGTAHASASDKGCFANGTSRTFMGWAYRDAALDLDTLFSSDASLLSNAWPALRVTTSNHVTWRTQNSGPAVQWSSAWPGTGQWVHWALTYNESTDEQALYIDGALVSSQTVVNSYAAGAGSFQVGRASASNVDPYDGKMAWVSVHPTALTGQQIAAIMVATRGAAWTNVRTWLDDGLIEFSGSTVQVGDFEAPNGVACQYRVRAYNAANATYSAWQAASATWASEDWWLVPYAYPRDSVNLKLRSYPSTAEQANQGVFRPLGSEAPVVVSDVRGPITGQITVLTDSQTERDTLWNAIRYSVPCLLKGPPSANIPDRWVMVGDSTSERLVDKGWSHQHDDTLSWTEVARPEGARTE